MRLERMTWPQAESRFKENDLVVLPIGSTECHGRHNALGTDFLVPSRLCELIEQRTDVLILPGLPYGDCNYFLGFPGSISIGSDLLEAAVKRICGCLLPWGIRRFVFLNGHGGNDHALEKAAYWLDDRGAIAALVDWWRLVGDLNPAWKGGHGGGEETSALLAIDEKLVDKTAVSDPGLYDLSPELRSCGMRSVEYKGVQIPVPRSYRKAMDNGWYGPDHPKDATKEWGDAMLTAAADYITDFIGAFSRVELGGRK